MAAKFEISLPDSLVQALGSDPAALPRRTLEAAVVQLYRAGSISHAQVSDALSLDRWQTDAFLKNAQAHRTWEAEKFSADLANLRSLGQ